MIVKHSKIHTLFRAALSSHNVRVCCLCGAENVSGEVCHLGSGGITTQRQIVKAFDKGILKYEGCECDKKLIAHRLADMPLLMTSAGCRMCNEKVLKEIKILPRSVLRSAIDVYDDSEFEMMLEALPFIRDFVKEVSHVFSAPLCFRNSYGSQHGISLINGFQKKFKDILEATGNMKKLREIQK